MVAEKRSRAPHSADCLVRGVKDRLNFMAHQFDQALDLNDQKDQQRPDNDRLDSQYDDGDITGNAHATLPRTLPATSSLTLPISAIVSHFQELGNE